LLFLKFGTNLPNYSKDSNATEKTYGVKSINVMIT
jgi:hypothetical protein